MLRIAFEIYRGIPGLHKCDAEDKQCRIKYLMKSIPRVPNISSNQQISISEQISIE